MEKPDLDRLIPIMPKTVLEEYICTGAGIMGFPPLVSHWLTTSTHPEVERFVNDLKEYTVRSYRAALRRQRIMNDHAGEFYQNGNKLVRMRAVIDPVLKGYNPKCFQDPSAINDTKRKEPKLFIP